MLKQGVVQGTHGWDVSIMARYHYNDHPAYMVDTMGYSEREVVTAILLAYTGPDDIFPSDYTLNGRIMERDFPYLIEPKQELHGSAQERLDLRARLSKGVGKVESFFKVDS